MRARVFQVESLIPLRPGEPPARERVRLFPSGPERAEGGALKAASRPPETAAESPVRWRIRRRPERR